MKCCILFKNITVEGEFLLAIFDKYVRSVHWVIFGQPFPCVHWNLKLIP